jgi:hypothetical protein
MGAEAGVTGACKVRRARRFNVYVKHRESGWSGGGVAE